jgi:hypothetical protein
VSHRAAIILPYGPDAWRVANLTEGFIRVAEALARGGFTVEVFRPQEAPAEAAPPPGITVTPLVFTAPPILAGPAPAHLSRSLRLGHQLWRRLADDPPDIVLAPMAGGILQPCLMSRRLGESLEATRFVIWGEAGAAERHELGDLEPAGISTVIDDALETTARRLADVIAGPREAGAAGSSLRLALPGRTVAIGPADSLRIDEIVFVGPASERHGAAEFLASIERMGHAGLLADRRVTFLGPWREGPMGLGKAMLGRRAQDWPFAFTQIDEHRPDKVLEHLRQRGVLAVFAGAAPDDDVILADAASAGLATAVSARHPLAEWLAPAIGVCAPDLADLDKFVVSEAPRPTASARAADWAGAFEAVIGIRRPRDRRVSARTASLCITHRNRTAELAAALHSRGSAAGPGLRTVVVDTGSTAESLSRLAALEAPGVEIIEGPPGARQGVARNLAASRSSGEILVFLDDDNLFVDEGLSRLIAAFDDPKVDLVAPNLAIHDKAAGEGRAMGDLVFMGFTGWAGLLFNGFGDANFAIRRRCFDEIGGFVDDDAAAFDWIFFAAAQARGREIGVLQKPAIGYQRDLAARDRKWRKLDLEGPRRQVLRAYGVDRQLALVLGLTQFLTHAAID